MLQSRKNASLIQMPPRRRISAVETIAAMTVATIADRIPAATVAVAVSAAAVDVAAEVVLGPAVAICPHRNMLRRKARTILVEIRVAMSPARRAKIVALNLEDSNRVAQRSAASIIAVPNRRAKAALLQ